MTPKSLFDVGSEKLLAEYKNGTLEKEYIYLDGQLVAIKAKGQSLLFVHNDHLGRPQIVSDKNQNIVWQADNQSFDRDVIKNEIGDLNIGFPGQYYDRESGLYYNINRDYDSSTGRYVQSDPIGLEGGINTYTYVLGNPINNVDPFGLDTISTRIITMAGRGDVKGLQGLLEGGGLSPAQNTLARSLLGRANKINHIFNKPKHNLDRLVKACGNKNKALDKLEDVFSKSAAGRADGNFSTIQVIRGQAVTIEGRIVNGVPKIGTAYIP